MPACLSSVVLGFIDADTFLHGEVPLDIKASERALATLGTKMALDIWQTADGAGAELPESLDRAARFRDVP